MRKLFCLRVKQMHNKILLLDIAPRGEVLLRKTNNYCNKLTKGGSYGRY